MNIFTGLQSPKVVYEIDSPLNGHIQVIEIGRTRKIRVDGIDQSLNPDSPAVSRLYWGKVIEVIQENYPDFRNILILGLGGGTIPHLISRNFPNSDITAVEFDPVMYKVSQEFFEVNSIPRLKVIIGDALRVVVEPEEHHLSPSSFSIVFVDIYVGQNYPDLGKSGSFVSALKRLVSPGGMVVFNRIYRESHQDDVNSFVDYLHTVLSDVKCTVVAGYTNSDNILIYGRVF